NCECGICGRRFYRNCSLALHLKSHDSEAGGAGCLRFYSVSELVRHEATCSPRSRPYQCQYCKKCYSQKSVLKKHLVIHTGERLTCALCGIDFTQKSSLLRHVKRMHSQVAEQKSAAGRGGDAEALPTVQSFMRNIKIPQGISISMVD
ncbi:hypothetical protein AAG570_007374, partial [Ranatra chinensis]